MSGRGEERVVWLRGTSEAHSGRDEEEEESTRRDSRGAHQSASAVRDSHYARTTR